MKPILKVFIFWQVYIYIFVEYQNNSFTRNELYIFMLLSIIVYCVYEIFYKKEIFLLISLGNNKNAKENNSYFMS